MYTHTHAWHCMRVPHYMYHQIIKRAHIHNNHYYLWFTGVLFVHYFYKNTHLLTIRQMTDADESYQLWQITSAAETSS